MDKNLCSSCVDEVDLAELQRQEILDMIHRGEIDPSPELIIINTDDLFQLVRADLIPCFYDSEHLSELVAGALGA